MITRARKRECARAGFCEADAVGGVARECGTGVQSTHVPVHTEAVAAAGRDNGGTG